MKTDLVCWTAFENSSGAAQPRKISFQNNNQQNAASYQIEKSYWLSPEGWKKPLAWQKLLIFYTKLIIFNYLSWIFISNIYLNVFLCTLVFIEHICKSNSWNYVTNIKADFLIPQLQNDNWTKNGWSLSNLDRVLLLVLLQQPGEK